MNGCHSPGGAVGAATDDVQLPGHLAHRLLPGPGGGSRGGDGTGSRGTGRVPPLTPPAAVYNNNNISQYRLTFIQIRFEKDRLSGENGKFERLCDTLDEIMTVDSGKFI